MFEGGAQLAQACPLLMSDYVEQLVLFDAGLNERFACQGVSGLARVINDFACDITRHRDGHEREGSGEERSSKPPLVLDAQTQDVFSSTQHVATGFESDAAVVSDGEEEGDGCGDVLRFGFGLEKDVGVMIDERKGASLRTGLEVLFGESAYSFRSSSSCKLGKITFLGMMRFLIRIK